LLIAVTGIVSALDSVVPAESDRRLAFCNVTVLPKADSDNADVLLRLFNIVRPRPPSSNDRQLLLFHLR